MLSSKELARFCQNSPPDSVLERLLSGHAPAEEFEKLLSLLEQMLEVGDRSAEMVEACWNRLIGRRLWELRHNTLEIFKEAIGYYHNIHPVIVERRSLQDRNYRNSQRIEKAWGQPLIELIPSDLMPQSPSKQFLDRMAALSELVPAEHAVRLLRDAQCTRRTQRRQMGESCVLTGDIVWAIGQAPGLAPLESSDGDLGSGDGDLGLGHGDLASGGRDLGMGHGDLSLGDGDMGLGDGDTPAPKRTRAKYAAPTTNCGCSIPCKEIVGALPQDRRFMGLDPGLKMLKLAYRVTGSTFRGFCFIHLRLLVSTATGMNNSYEGANEDSVISRLVVYLQYRKRIPELRRRNYHWFHTELQNNATRSKLGDMKYAPQQLPVIKIDSQMTFDRFGNETSWQEFSDKGSVNIGGIFTYLLDDPRYTEWINLEFGMYEHHFHPKGNSGKRLGWLRNMWFSLPQQIIRQDPAYYALMAAARPDKNWRLISYPYYTKHTTDGEKIGFSHLDLNIQHFVGKEKGANLVQGGVSLMDETPGNCTTLVPGFHKHARQWYADLQARKEGNVTGFTTNCKSLYSPVDRAKYGDLVPVPCKKGDIRITLPEIIHGTTPRADGERQVVLPWFTGIREDLEHLENEDCETWSEIAACHRDMVPCDRSPSGRSAKAYQRGPPFQAAVQLPSSSNIGDALVGRQRWDRPQVLSQLKVLFGPDRGAAMEFVRSTREKLKEGYERAWAELVALEQEMYGEKSYFWLRKQSLEAPVADGSSGSEVDCFDEEVMLTSEEEIE